MASKRGKIRWFINEVRWSTPRSVAYFMAGRCDRATLRAYSSELSEMQKVKDSSLRLKALRNQEGKRAYTLKAKYLPTFMFNHDACLRDVLGKLLHDRGMAEVSFAKPSDASIHHYRLELDNGHMDMKQLGEKIMKHYTRPEMHRCQIVFIMRHREFPHLEDRRLGMLFKLSKMTFKDKPNKVLGACYTKFLEDGKLFNRKGREILKDSWD